MNKVDFYHSGDLGDTVYSIPSLRRLAHPAHVTLYPAPGVTRQLMDENNANMLLPLLNVQNGVTADWKPTHGSDGLRLEVGVRRFYRDGYNLCDIHNNWVGHDHWPLEHPWLIVDKPDYRYKIVCARSARYRNDRFPWAQYAQKFKGRACFVGVPWEHEDFEKHFGKIPYVPTESLLDVARLMAGADLVIANQSCPRAVAEALKTPIIVEQNRPINTHFGRDYAWYLQGDKTPLPVSWDDATLENIWCRNAANRAMGRSDYTAEHLAEIARLTRGCRNITGDALVVGESRGGVEAVTAFATQRNVYTYEPLNSATTLSPDQDVEGFLRVYRHKFLPAGQPQNSIAFAVVIGDGKELCDNLVAHLCGLVSPGGVIVFNNTPLGVLRKYADILGMPIASPKLTGSPTIYAFTPSIQHEQA